MIPKAPSRNLLDADPAVLSKVIRWCRSWRGPSRRRSSADGITVTQFNEAPAGQTVFHLHFHIIPRYEDSRLKPHSGKMEDKGVLAANAEKIIGELGVLIGLEQEQSCDENGDRCQHADRDPLAGQEKHGKADTRRRKPQPERRASSVPVGKTISLAVTAITNAVATALTQYSASELLLQPVAGDTPSQRQMSVASQPRRAMKR